MENLLELIAEIELHENVNQFKSNIPNYKPIDGYLM